jgi:hypothetical protein
MVRGKYAKGVVLLLSCLVPARVIALPTLSERDRAFVAYPLSASSEAYTHYMPQSAQTIGLCTAGSAARPAAFHRSSVSFAGSPAPANGVRSLPSIPRAILMALTGFICVSLVRDRRFWLAALAGLVWMGQAGFAALSRLAWHRAGRKAIEQTSSSAVDGLCKPERPYCPRGHIERTRCTGVPGNLAGISECPASWSLPVSFLSSRAQWAFTGGQHHATWNLKQLNRLSARSVRVRENLGARQSATARVLSCPIRAGKCSVPGAGQSIRFSRVFLCVGVARGPPDLPWCATFP